MNKALIKEKSIEIVKIIAFVLSFFVLLQCLALAGLSEKSATKFNNRKKDAYSFVNDESNTLQIVNIGNSDVYSGVVPLELWRQNGNTSTVCASIHQTVQESTDLMKLIYQQQSPELVIIEADMFYDDDPDVENNIKTSKTLSDFFDRMNPDNFTRKVEGVYTIFKFHNYWQGGKDNKKNAPYNAHGYKYSTEVRKLHPLDYMIPSDETYPIKKVFSEQLDNLIKLCKDNSSKVMILALPSINSWNYARHNSVAEFAKERNIPFLDTNLYLDEIGIDITDCFRDEGNHLNYKGAKAVTEYLGNYIKENYDLEDLRDNKQYSSWNVDLQKFDRFRNK